MKRDPSPRTIVVGLDGAGFDLLTPWVRDGELPTISRLLEEGVSGNLESVFSDMDGGVLKEIFASDPPAKRDERIDTARGNT